MGIDHSADTIRRVHQRAASGQLAFALHIGDISYADDHIFWFQDGIVVVVVVVVVLLFVVKFCRFL
jgi:hypothetical protein